MKKYACNRLYYSLDKSLSPSVVCLNDRGEVLSFSLLKNELDATEWIGGVIVLSQSKDLKLDKDFHHFLLSSFISEDGCLYAWHISEFDFTKEDFSLKSTLKRLG